MNDGAVAKPGRTLYLWNADASITYTVQVADDGTPFKADKLPAGRWVARASFGRNTPAVSTFELKPAETTNVDIPAVAEEVRTSKIGMLGIRVFTEDSALTPCHVTLTPAEPVRRNQQRGETTFVGAPGRYSLEIKLKGFEPIKRDLVFNAASDSGAPANGWQHDIVIREVED